MSQRLTHLAFASVLLVSVGLFWWMRPLAAATTESAGKSSKSSAEKAAPAAPETAAAKPGKAAADKAAEKAAAAEKAPAAPAERRILGPGETELRRPRSFSDYVERGGLRIIPIIGCSIVALAFVIERFLSLRRRKIMPDTFFEDVADYVRDGETGRAQALCRESRMPLARLLHAVLLCANGNRTDMEAALENEGGRVVWQMRQNGKALGVIANVAMLFGLLGTVIGMINAFEAYAWAHGTPRPEVLAVGIYEALVTTAGGLAVAIPSLLFFHYFRGRADAMVRDMEELGLELINVTLQNRAPGLNGRGARGGDVA